MSDLVSSLAALGAVVIGLWVLAVMAVVLDEIRRAIRRLRGRRCAAAWREIHGRVRDGLGPGEES